MRRSHEPMEQRSSGRSRRRVGRDALWFCILALAACSAPPWDEVDPAHGRSWRGRTAYVVGPDVVLASRSASARQLAEWIADLRGRLGDAGVELEPLVVVAVEARDPPLFEGTAEQQAQRLARMHAVALGREMPAESPGSMSPDVPPELADRAPGIVTVGFDTRADLGIPPEIVGDRAWGIVTPTEDCLGDFLRESALHKMEAEGVSAVGRVAFRSAWGVMKGRLLEDVEKHLRRRPMYGLVLHRAGIDEASESEAAARVAAALGVEAEVEVEEVRLESVEDFASVTNAVAPSDPRGFLLAWHEPGVPGVDVDGKLYSIHVVVEVNDDGRTEIKPIDFSGRSRFVRARFGRAPSRSDLRRLCAAIDEGPAGRVLLDAPTRAFGATLALWHAARDPEASREELLELWRVYGMDDAPEFSDSGLRPYLERPWP
jgi:hypothetical protein